MPNTSLDLPVSNPAVVIVQGSPRRYGNCEALADEAAKICRGAGLKVTLISIPELLESGEYECNGCMHCFNSGSCMRRDAVQPIYDSLDNAAGLLWITPIYFGSVPGPLKCLVDRFQLFWSRRMRGERKSYPSRRPAAAVIIGTGGDPFGTEAARIPLTSASNCAEFSLFEPVILASSMDQPGAILDENHTAQLQLANAEFARFADSALRWSTRNTTLSGNSDAVGQSAAEDSSMNPKVIDDL